MQDREAKIPANAKSRLTEAVQRLIDLYTAWDKPDEAAKWKEMLDMEKAKHAPQPDSK